MRTGIPIVSCAKPDKFFNSAPPPVITIPYVNLSFISALATSRITNWRISVDLASTYLDNSCSDILRFSSPFFAGTSNSRSGDDIDAFAEP